MKPARTGLLAALAALAALAIGTAVAAPVFTVDLPADDTAFGWTRLPDGRFELKVNRQARITLPPQLPEGMALESHDSAQSKLLVIKLPTSGAVALQVVGNQLQLGETSAPKPPSLPTAMGGAATPPAAGASAAAPVAGASAPAGNPILEALKKNLGSKKDAAVANFQNYQVDMSVPASPALSVLGATPETMLQPKSPRDLAVSLAQGLANKDKLGKGIGFDVSPYLLARGKQAKLSDYQDSPWLQFWANTQVSFGAIQQDSGSDKITRAAIGGSFVLLDKGDPRARDSALSRCFTEIAIQDVGVGTTGTGPLPGYVLDVLKAQQAGSTAPPASMVAAAQQLSSDFDKCRSDFKKTTWNSTRWTAGLGQAYHNRDGGSHVGATGLWTTFSLNLTDDDSSSMASKNKDARAQALFHYRTTRREEVASTTDPRGFALRSSDLLATGLKYGSDQRNFSIETSWRRGHYDTGERETSRKLAVGAELMINKDFWLVVTVGGEGGLKNGSNSPFVLGGLKFGSASEPTGMFVPSGSGSGK